MSQTSIYKAINIGPAVGAKLESINITTLEKLQELGYQEVMIQLIEHYPECTHTMFGRAIAGAEYSQNCMMLDADLKFEVDQFMKKLKKDVHY